MNEKTERNFAKEAEIACAEGRARNLKLTGELQRAVERITEGEEEPLGKHNLEFMNLMNKLNDNMEEMVKNVNDFMIDDFMYLMIKMYLLKLDDEHKSVEYVTEVMKVNAENAVEEINEITKVK